MGLAWCSALRYIIDMDSAGAAHQPKEITMNATPTRSQIATSFALWGEYFDTGREMTRAEFDSLSRLDKIRLQLDAFGIPKHDIEAQQLGAANHGDGETIALCDAALAGDLDAAAQVVAGMDDTE
jgi:hypothetical protein